MTHGKFRTSVLCLLHTATNLPSAFSASSPSSLQSMWPVSKRARLFKYCSAPLTYSKPPCASPLPRGEGPPFCTCRSKWQPTPILAGRAWRATVHGVTKSWTQLSACARTRVHTHTHTHTRNGRYVAREFMQRNAGGSVRIMFRQQNICFCYHQDLWLRHSPAYFL